MKRFVEADLFRRTLAPGVIRLSVVMLVFALCFAVAAAFSAPGESGKAVEFPARDGFLLRGDLFLAHSEGAGVLLFHQCNFPEQLNRKSLVPLAKALRAKGLNVLALDFRSFGDSTSDAYRLAKTNLDLAHAQRTMAFSHFVDDAAAALAFLKKQDPVDPSRLALVGASCGGAMAVRTALAAEGVRAIVLLSPYLPPFWIGDEHWRALERAGIHVFAAAAREDDSHGSYSNARRAVEAAATPESEFHGYEGDSHGAPLFAHDPDLVNAIADWLAARLTPGT